MKTEQSNEDTEGKLLKKQEESRHLINHNQYLTKQIKNLKVEKLEKSSAKDVQTMETKTMTETNGLVTSSIQI